MNLPPFPVIMGPTASGKSALAIAAALEFDGEIISMDSMQVYRGLDIGTAKPSPEEQRKVPHHLIDILDISEPYDTNRFVSLATKALDDICSRGHKAFLAGGTGLYARALIYGFNLLPSDRAVFQRLDNQSHDENGRKELLARLEKAAQSNGTTVPEECRLNPRRLVRTCEVLELTGKPPWLLKQKTVIPNSRFIQFCIVPPLPMIKHRIFQRTCIMLENGWIEEARQAEAAGLLNTPTARQALGYQDIIAFLSNSPTANIDGLCELLANKTVQYARRQLTWFKHQHPGAIMLVPPSPDNAADWLTEQISTTIS